MCSGPKSKDPEPESDHEPKGNSVDVNVEGPNMVQNSNLDDPKVVNNNIVDDPKSGQLFSYRRHKSGLSI